MRKEKLCSLPTTSKFSCWVFEPRRRVAIESQGEVWIDGHSVGTFDEARDFRFSPNGQHWAFVAKKKKQFFVMSDGKDHAPYEFVGHNSLTWSADGMRLAYTAFTQKKHWVVVDNEKIGPFDEGQPNEGFRTPSLSFNPKTGKILYVACRKNQWRAAEEGKLGPAFEKILQVAAAADGTIFYKAKRDDGWYAVCGSKQFGPFTLITDVAYSAPTKKLAFLAKQGNSYRAMVGTSKIGEHTRATQLTALADGRWAYHANEEDRSARVWLGQRGSMEAGPKYANTLGFAASADGKRIAYCATKNDKEYFVTLNHKPQMPKLANIVHDSLRFSSDGKTVAYVATDEPGSGKGSVVIGKHICPRSDGVFGDLVFSENGKELHYASQIGNELFWVTTKIKRRAGQVR